MTQTCFQTNAMRGFQTLLTHITSGLQVSVVVMPNGWHEVAYFTNDSEVYVVS